MIADAASTWQIFSGVATVLVSLTILYTFLMRGFDKRTKSSVADALHDHMKVEEQELKKARKLARKAEETSAALASAIAEVKQALDDRSATDEQLHKVLTETQGILQAHMAHDDRMVEVTGGALTAGQELILGHFETLKTQLALLRERVEQVAASAGQRVETQNQEKP